MLTRARSRSGHEPPFAVRALSPCARAPRLTFLPSDPDIQHLPFLAISPAFFASLWSSYYKFPFVFDRAARFFTQLQHQLFYVVMSLARFNLCRLSYAFLLKRSFAPKRAKGAVWSHWLEVAGIVCFWSWYIPVLRGTGSWQKALAYLLISNVVPSPLHVQVPAPPAPGPAPTNARALQIVLSHFSRSTADLGPAESFPARQLRTTTDVACPPALSFLHGGLELQVTHHLFPRLPRHRLRAASALVKRFAAARGLEYAEFGFVAGNAEVRGVLRAVAEQVAIVGKVAQAEVREAVAKAAQKKDL
jgi:delta8-fatty-acid desaturase